MRGVIYQHKSALLTIGYFSGKIYVMEDMNLQIKQLLAQFDRIATKYIGHHSDVKSTHSLEYENKTHNIMIDHILSEGGEKELVWISQIRLEDLYNNDSRPSGLNFLYDVGRNTVPDDEYYEKAPATDGHKLFLIGELHAAIEHAQKSKGLKRAENAVEIIR